MSDIFYPNLDMNIAFLQEFQVLLRIELSVHEVNSGDIKWRIKEVYCYLTLMFFF